MKRKLVLDFTKMAGAGNDFVVVDNRFYHFSDEELAGLARRLCPRRTGIGADGLLAFAPPSDEVHHFRMRYVNADGSVATLCGNGARCLARFARSAGLTADPLVFETDAGILRAHVPADPEAPVRLHVPPPRNLALGWALDDPPDDVPLHYVWTGTEHVVRFEDAVAEAAVERIGPRLRADASLAPAGANVNFVQVVHVGGAGSAGQEAALEVRTYEKGVEGETHACGTGALAAAVVAHRAGHVRSRRVHVHMPGGTLTVEMHAEDGTLRALVLEGPVAAPFRGTVEV